MRQKRAVKRACCSVVGQLDTLAEREQAALDPLVRDAMGVELIAPADQ